MNLSKDQNNAIRQILNWLKKPNSKYITIGGYAGTGKTTIISILRQELFDIDKNIRVAFCSFTGKASRVLASKLEENDCVQKGDSISTIHSLIYSAILNQNDEIIGWTRKDYLNFDLIIVDEASMIDEAIWTDLLSYDIPIIAVGDHGQLPPISGKFNLMSKPNIMLTEIHRQAKDNPIIELSIQARNTGFIPFGTYGNNIKKLNLQENQETLVDLISQYNDETIILCGYNNSRIKLNKYVRKQLYFESDMPQFKDRVICLKNNRSKEIYNGMIGKIESIEQDFDLFFAKINFEDVHRFSGLILPEQFNSKNLITEKKSNMEYDFFDFGYAITVHKAQGSQYKRVILFEEKFNKSDDDMWKKWLYTAVTRATDELFIFSYV